MNPVQQIPRNALVWMIICLFALVAPHAARLPLWVLAVYIIAVVWRLQVHRGRWSFPGNALKIALTVSSFAGIFLSYGSLVGLEPTVALLLTAFAFKFIELSQRKDAYVLLFLGYFVCLTEFLFSQDLLITVYSLLCVTLVTTALVALHQPGQHEFRRGTIGLAGAMLLQAMPMMIVLFFLFPRIGPLWTVPISKHSGKTGMSDFMKPGDVASLSQSSDVAFRVKFDGHIPPNKDLYWRGLVFSKLEQGIWSSLSYYEVPVGEQRPEPVATEGEPLGYSIIIEPTQQNWLYGLHYAQSSTPGVMHSSDFRLFSPSVVEVETLYRAKSWKDAVVETDLSGWRRNTETRLPPEGNPRTRRLALALREEVATDAQFVDLVLDRFNREPYVYTLQPGALSGRDTIDQFLFETRRGFCEHYASAFVFMMRAVGVPARVIAGYQGGETNPVNKTVIVHQFDAHAWAEVWLPDRGWVRADPTAAVAPQRIELGLEQAVLSEGSFLAAEPLSPVRFRSIPLLNQIRLRYDALTYRWQSWVVGFNSNRQMELLRDFFGEISARSFATVFMGSWALVLIPLAISLLYKRDTSPTSPADKHYRIFCKRLAVLGLRRRPGEAPGEFAARAAAAVPDASGHVWRITHLYSELAYEQGEGGGKDEILARFIRAVAGFKPDRRRKVTDEDLIV